MNTVEHRSDTTPESDRVRAMFHRVSNEGRWGTEGARGTLNLIDDATRLRAVGSVVSGRSYAIGQEIIPAEPGSAVTNIMITPDCDASTTCRDRFTIAPHGFETTHIDALGHCFFDGRLWGGARAADVVTEEGLTSAAIDDLRDGIVTRGILLDVAGALGVDHLEADHVIEFDDLDRAERYSCVQVEPGDAVFVRSGRSDWERLHGPDSSRRAGMGLGTLGWLREKDVAVYSGDCVDVVPSPYPAYPDYFHQIALAGMGLILLDLPDLGVLMKAVETEGRHSFLLTASPLPIRGATGSAVNPLVVF